MGSLLLVVLKLDTPCPVRVNLGNTFRADQLTPEVLSEFIRHEFTGTEMV